MAPSRKLMGTKAVRLASCCSHDPEPACTPDHNGQNANNAAAPTSRHTTSRRRPVLLVHHVQAARTRERSGPLGLRLPLELDVVGAASPWRRVGVPHRG